MNWKEKITETISTKFQNRNVLVIGDLMVDEYVFGKVSRISPEAPVPVLDYKEKKFVAGGACNVANNLKTLGANVFIAGVAAYDNPGIWLRDYLGKLDINVSCIIEEKNRPTTLKTRFAVKGQQLLRVDYEVTNCITEETQKKIMNYVNESIDFIDAIIISDYTKGVFYDPKFVEEIISLCRNNQILVVVDSKSKGIQAFAGADFVKPNNLELEAAVGIMITDDKSLNMAGEKYLSLSGAKALIVTRGSNGISVFEPGLNRVDYPAKNVQVFDVCGAGDTVISTITLGMCSGLPISDAVRMANLAAGIVISQVGTVAVTYKELIESINEE